MINIIYMIFTGQWNVEPEFDTSIIYIYGNNVYKEWYINIKQFCDNIYIVWLFIILALGIYYLIDALILAIKINK